MILLLIGPNSNGILLVTDTFSLKNVVGKRDLHNSDHFVSASVLNSVIEKIVLQLLTFPKYMFISIFNTLKHKGA